MTRTRIIKALLAFLLLATGAALAQVDDRARELLEGMAAQVQADEIRTMDQTMVMTLHDMDEPIETRTRTVVDYEGKRAAIVADVMGQTTTMIHQDGLTMMSLMGMKMPIPPSAGDAFEGIFDTGATGDLLSDPDAKATYDGQVSYADVLSGQQVSYNGNFGVPGMQSEASTVRLVFDDAGKLIGQVMEQGGEVLVSVFVGEPKVDGALFYDIDMYKVTGETATPYATLRYESISINEPIDETLFE